MLITCVNVYMHKFGYIKLGGGILVLIISRCFLGNANACEIVAYENWQGLADGP